MQVIAADADYQRLAAEVAASGFRLESRIIFDGIDV